MKNFKQLTIAALGLLLLLGNTQTGMSQNTPQDIIEVDKTLYTEYVPFDASKQKQMPQKRNRGVTKATGIGQRPDHINNALSMYYPPVFNQSGGSCGSAQAIGYMFTHEMNSWRNKDASFEENQYTTHFTWLFTNQGTAKTDIMVANGIPNVTTYGGRTYSGLFGYQTTDNYDFGWMQGYDKWFAAMHNRSTEFFYGPRVSATDEDSQEQLKQWLWNRWGTKGYNDGGVAGFGVASGGKWGKVPSTAINDEIGVTNKYCVSAWGKTYDHGLTIVGYDDRIEFDLDSNGVYGEPGKNETGAWIICNSWGQGWCDGGFIYCPYAFSYCVLRNGTEHYLDWATELYSHRPDFVPQRTIKLLMDYDHRWELQLSAGVSQDPNATTPDKTTDFVHFRGATCYDQSGVSPAVPMLGKWADGLHHEPMEFGYDLTDLAAGLDKTKPIKYFFFVNTRSGGIGAGHLYKASILNYEFDRENPTEIPFDIDTIDIKGGEQTLCVSVVVPGEPVNPPYNAVLSGNALTWSAPNAVSLPLLKYYIYKGGELIDSTAVTKRQYTVANPDAVYSVAAVYSHNSLSLVSQKSNNAGNPVILPDEANKVLNLAGNGITLPNTITPAISQATIEFLINPDSLGRNINQMDIADNNFFIGLTSSGQVSAGWSTKNASDYANTAAGVIKPGKWYHVAVTIDNNELSIYINGMKRKSCTSLNYSGLPEMNSFSIGTPDAPMHASIDEFRIWRTARTAAEILMSRNTRIANPSANDDLLAYLPMDIIEDEGEAKVREYVLANHACFNNLHYTQATDETAFSGTSATMPVAINCDATTVVAGTPTRFSASSPLSSIKWEWSAPEAESRTYLSKSPYITYGKPGTYTLSLTVTDQDNTTQTATKEVEVVAAELPVAAFTVADTLKSTGEAFSLVNRSTGDNLTYTWTLEGANNQILHSTNATAIYDRPGTYTVTLTATNTSGSTSASKTITVKAAPPTPLFSVSPSNILLGETTYLVDESRGVINDWLWTLNNQKTLLAVSGQNSSFTPTRPGIYDISLTTTNDIGATTLTKKRLLCVSNADAKNSLSFAGNEQVSFQSPLTSNCKTWTIDWWMYPTQYTGAGGFYTDNGFASLHGVADGAYKVSLGNSSFTTATGYVILNEWHHYAITYSLGTIKFYRDGKIWQAPTDKITYTTGNWSGNWTISNTETPFKGLIDELRIWSKANTPSSVAETSNSPIENPSALSALRLYYNFNQGQGDVTDQTAAGNDGVRQGFGPDGDAWPLAQGVFTLDLSNEDNTPTDVSDQYLTNYKSPFFYDPDHLVNSQQTNRFFALEQGTDQSTWQLRGASTLDGITTGVHVDKGYGYGFTAQTSYYGFDTQITDHRAYQTVTLPAGQYTFGINLRAGSGDYRNSRIVAAAAQEIPLGNDLRQALANTTLTNGNEIRFTLGKETEVSLGMLYNLKNYARLSIESFYLTRRDIRILEADGETSVYDAIRNGHAQEAYARPGGIVIASEARKNFRIYTANGQCVFNDEVQGVHFLPFQKGIYIVNGIKVAVK